MRKLTNEEANDLLDGEIVDGWKLLKESILDHGRFDLHKENVYFKYDEEGSHLYYIVAYSQGATEHQDYGLRLGSHGPAKKILVESYVIE